MVQGKWSPEQPCYVFALHRSEKGIVIDPTLMVKELIDDCLRHVDVALCSRKFHNGLIDIYAGVAKTIAEETNIKTIAFGGGCFQNAYLRCGLRSRLEMDGFTVFSSQCIPAGDAGLSFGQAVVAASVAMQSKQLLEPSAEEKEPCSVT
jgi:hydrogenase maturation protein HypF